MQKRLAELQKLSAPLEPGLEERARLTEKVVIYAQTFLETLPQKKAYVTTADKGIGLYEYPIAEEGIDIDTALALLNQHVDRPGVQIGSGNYLAFIPGSGLYTAALADYLAAVANRYAGVFFASPGAVRMEQMLLSWMADFLGYPPSAGGDLTSGGSIANLVGIVSARDAHQLTGKDFARAVVYLTSQSHHSIDKALRIAGLGECIRRHIPLDNQFRMDTTILAQTISADRQAGLIPWLIVASAGTTDTGAVDPLADIAALADRYQCWFHVDGAYGAAFALSPLGKEILAGIELSDSLIIDPHKGLFIPFGSGCVLVRDRQHLLQSHYYQANYMQDIQQLAPGDEISPADMSPELSRHFRGLRLWLPLQLAGVAPFRAALEEKLLLARYFYAKIQEIAGFEVGPAPDLSIVTFRYRPPRGDINLFNQQLNQALLEDGRIFITSTTIAGQFTLRMAILGFRTHKESIDLALTILQEKAIALSQNL